MPEPRQPPAPASSGRPYGRLSSKAAAQLGIKNDGTAKVTIEATEEQLAAARKDDEQTAENSERQMWPGNGVARW